MSFQFLFDIVAKMIDADIQPAHTVCLSNFLGEISMGMVDLLQLSLLPTCTCIQCMFRGQFTATVKSV